MTLRQLVAFAAMSFATASTALAFDLPPPVDAPEYTGTIAESEGWYIRGDLGYNGDYKIDKPKVRTFLPVTSDYSSTRFDKARMDDGEYSLNAGIGYQFNDWLRADTTIDYFTGKLRGKSVEGGPCIGQAAGTRCGTRYDQHLASLGLMANAYVDLGTYWGLTPYVGAGAGATNVDWGTLKHNKYCVGGRNACNPLVRYPDLRNPGEESWRLTYAFMAGLSYDIAPSMKLDFGYRYSHVNGGDMAGWTQLERRSGAKGAKSTDNGFSRHEFRAGLRVTNW